MRGHTVTLAILDVAAATTMARGRQVRSTMPQAKRAPAAGTLYTAASPAPAAPQEQAALGRRNGAGADEQFGTDRGEHPGRLLPTE